jgi:hypothetical protein
MEERMSGFCITKAGRGAGSGNNCGTGTKCGRWNPTTEQVKLLTDLFRSGLRTPSTDEIQNISTQLSFYGKIESKNVFYWFQNHKARERQKRRRLSVDEKDAMIRRDDRFSSARCKLVLHKPLFFSEINMKKVALNLFFFGNLLLQILLRSIM